jgi:hypothetical protein
MLTYKTIKAGEWAAVWDRRGAVRIVPGPKRVLTFGRKIDLLPCHAAGPHQYLAVRFRDGRVQHLSGPTALWQHPLDHAAIETRNAIMLDANEAIIVYAQEPDRVSRRIVRGPVLFVPAASEWLHQFSWHGADPNDARRQKVPHALKFTKLLVIPDQTYFDVQDVRTADDALLVVRLMIFFELVDVQTMLDQTHDPIADFINAVSADVIDFVAARSFDRFKEQTELLNDLASYPQLTQRATRIGYRINKVVYRGYQANAKLQAMHDGAIEARTRLRLEAETERQAQELADLKLQREAERAERRQAMERDDQEHRNALARLAHDEDLRRRAADEEAKLAALRRRQEMHVEHEQARHRERIAYLQAMNGLQVDLTRYLVARYQHPDRLIRIDGGARGGNGTQLHLHERVRGT